jgi:peptidoglycan/xylan/chitin deacetylase (PgdA/CDA1 family)
VTPTAAAAFPCGLMLHRFRKDPTFPWQGALTADQLEAMLLEVGVENILSPDEWLHRLREGHLEAPQICITFDDGLRSQVEVAKPVLDRYGVKAFWFIYTCVFEGAAVSSEVYSYAAALCGGMDVLMREFLAELPAPLAQALSGDGYRAYAVQMRTVAPFYTEDDLRFRYLRNEPRHREAFTSGLEALFARRGVDLHAVVTELWMRPEDARALSDEGHHVGLHSHTHPLNLAALSYEDQRLEYETNYAAIEHVTGVLPQAVAYPLGSYDERSLAILRNLGIACGFLPHATGGLQGINPTPWEIARLDPANFPSMQPSRGAAHAVARGH